MAKSKECGQGQAERLKLALAALERAYPDAAPQLVFSSPFELLIATMLSAQCTDKQVNRCTAPLFETYKDAQSFLTLSEEALIRYIHACGFFNTKAKNILSTCALLVSEYGGEVPQERELLMQLPGVGRKTANVVLSNAFGVPAIAVDTHVFRVANRIGFACAGDVFETEKQLMQNIPQVQWSQAHHWLIFHGRQVCTARKPRCESCTVREYCAQYIEENKAG